MTQTAQKIETLSAVIDNRTKVATLIDAFYRIQDLRKSLELREKAMCRDEIVLKHDKRRVTGKPTKKQGFIIEETDEYVLLEPAKTAPGDEDGKIVKIERSKIEKIHRRRFDNEVHARAALFNFDRAGRHRDFSSLWFKKMEVDIEGEIRDMLDDWPVWTEWMKNVKGAGPLTAGVLWSNVDILKAENISQLWKFAGHHTVDGGIPKLKKGEKRSWSNRVQTSVWNCGEALVKAKSGYYDLYLKIKEGEIQNRFTEVDPEPGKLAGYILDQPLGEKKKGFIVKDALSAARLLKGHDGKRIKVERRPSHINSRAKRKMRKVFLAHFHMVWRDIEKLPVEPVYVIYSEKYPTHTTEIPIIEE